MIGARYAYVANDPLNNIDPSGLLLAIISIGGTYADGIAGFEWAWSLAIDLNSIKDGYVTIQEFFTAGPAFGAANSTGASVGIFFGELSGARGFSGLFIGATFGNFSGAISPTALAKGDVVEILHSIYIARTIVGWGSAAAGSVTYTWEATGPMRIPLDQLESTLRKAGADFKVVIGAIDSALNALSSLRGAVLSFNSGLSMMRFDRAVYVLERDLIRAKKILERADQESGDDSDDDDDDDD